MEKRERKDGAEDRSSDFYSLKSSIKILRDVTWVVRLTPFVYALLFIPSMVLYLFCSDSVLDIIDKTMFVSPIVVVFMFILSFKLKFCNWYRTQCALPLLPQVLVIIDDYIYNFRENVACVIVVTTILIFILSLINTYKVFLKF